ncbi:MAG: hypothetical protein LBQ86_08820 [Holophagales bacterium]|jgi:hypothetical protein|nr:hypothetical protein [Holophagales bacterium]
MNNDLEQTDKDQGGANQGNDGDLSSLPNDLWSRLDDAIGFDLLENPQNWPDDPAIQAELAELLEIHLAMKAHADDLASAIAPTKGFRRFVSGWMLPAAAIMLAVLPTLYAVSNIRETRRMRARGAVLEVQLQKRLTARLWSDFFNGSLDLLEQVKTPAGFCDPKREDRSVEVEQARRLYAMGRSLPLDVLNDPEALDARKNLQNWLTEVSANDACMTPERSLELLDIAQEMDLEAKAYKLNHKLRKEYS